MMGSTLSPLTRLAVFSHLTLVTTTMTGSTMRRPSLIINPTMDTTFTNQSSTTSGIISRLSHKRYKRDNIAVRYDLPADIIRNKRDSRYFPGHVPGGVKGITKVNCQGYHMDGEYLFYKTMIAASSELYTKHSESDRIWGWWDWTKRFRTSFWRWLCEEPGIYSRQWWLFLSLLHEKSLLLTVIKIYYTYDGNQDPLRSSRCGIYLPFKIKCWSKRPMKALESN